MTNVACFCGCLYSFDSDAGVCPGCGEYATVRTGPAVTCSGGAQPSEQRALAAWQDRQDGRTPERFSPRDWVLVSELLDRVSGAGALAGGPRAGRAGRTSAAELGQ